MSRRSLELLVAGFWGALVGFAGVLFLVAMSGGCGATCMETEDPAWAPSSSGACGPHPTPLTTGTSEAQ
jgi:hypothetical protein